MELLFFFNSEKKMGGLVLWSRTYSGKLMSESESHNYTFLNYLDILE